MLFKFITREQLGTPNTLVCEYVRAEDMLSREHVSTQDTLAREHVRHAISRPQNQTADVKKIKQHSKFNIITRSARDI